jgi:hypothetical protein
LPLGGFVVAMDNYVSQVSRSMNPAYGPSTTVWAQSPDTSKSIWNKAVMMQQNMKGECCLYKTYLKRRSTCDYYLIAKREITPILFTDQVSNIFDTLINKFDNNLWESPKEFKKFILGKFGFLVRVNLTTGPYTGEANHCHCETYTKEHICKHCIMIQLYNKGGVAPKGRPKKV